MKRQFDDCSFCGGKVVFGHVQKPCFWGNELIAIIGDVPAGICEQCGERYFESKVLKVVESMLRTRKRFHEEIKVPIASFVGA